ncbi:MAG: Ig-like domain-containing protein [archaeon]
MNGLMRLTRTMLLLAIALIASVMLVNPVSFTTNPTISPANPDTTYNLVCSWNASADTIEQNVTWYNESTVYRIENVSTPQSTVGANIAKREQIWNCSVTLSNGTDTTTQTTNVTIANAPPTTPTMKNGTGIAVGNTTTAVEDMVNSFNITSTDPDGDVIAYDKIGSLPAGASLNSGTGIFTWTPEEFVNNDTNITFYATDNYGEHPGITTKKVLFVMQYVNDAPYITPSLGNIIMKEGERLNYTITGADEESNTPFNFTVNVTPSLDLVVINTSSTTGTIMFTGNRTALFVEAGNYTVNVTIRDSIGASNMSSFNLEIEQTNQPPVFRAIANYSSIQGAEFSFYAYADDPDAADHLSFNVTPISCSLANPWNVTITNNSRNGTALVNGSVLTNSHVACRDIRIIVIDDLGVEDSKDVFLNISNTNDPPIVEVLNSYIPNTAGPNISNQTGFAESEFIYQVNATDIDMLTYANDSLTYSNNNTELFTINSSTGIIRFTPGQGDVGNYSINITATDLNGSSASRAMIFSITNNSRPQLRGLADIVNCSEDIYCFVLLNATDAENDNLTFSSNNTAIFNTTNNYSESIRHTAYVNYTPTQGMVRNYSVNVTVQDARGAVDNKTIIFVINNTNDPPTLSDFSFPTIVAMHSAYKRVYADDDDYDLASNLDYENVTFNSTNISGRALFTIGTVTDSLTNESYGEISFIPTPADAITANFTVRICATDVFGAYDCRDKNLTVLPQSNPPNITQITPYMFANGTLSTGFLATSNFSPNRYNTITFPEGMSLLYNLNITNEVGETLSYNWTINGITAGAASQLSRSYDYFSAGSYNISVFVADDMFENSSWSWSATVTDVNRAPILVTSLSNKSNITLTRTYTSYFKIEDGDTRFIDPDDDLNSNNEFDGNETSYLNISGTNCSIATLTIEGNDLTVRPLEIGSCAVHFTATDPGSLAVDSNTVIFDITEVPNETSEVPVPQPSTGGGGGGRSNTVITPTKKEELKPKALELVVPEVITSYENKTVIIPVTIQNTWNTSLKKINLSASTTAKDVKFTFSKDYFEELPKGEKRNVTLMVDNYRMGEDYNIRISANVSEPYTSDSALVLLNTIQQSKVGKDVQTKVTFAQDLLNENPECLELNELLTKAKEEIAKGSAEEAGLMVDSVIEGCKYLVSISKKAEQKPETIVSKIIRKENMKYLLPFLALAGIITITLLSIRKKKTAQHRKAEAEAEKHKEEDEVKPYWP